MSRKIILILVLLTSILTVSSEQEPQISTAGQFKLAKITPKGAIIYLQSENLKEQFEKWLNSETHELYFQSANWRSFQRSRLFLKLKNRIQDFQDALGFELTENQISTWIGGRSAFAIYDPFAFDMLFITELPKDKAVASSFFKQISRFENRMTDNQQVYYLHEVNTDEGRLQKAIAFAFEDGKLVLSTSENLMRRALENLENLASDKTIKDGMLEEVIETVNKAMEFSKTLDTLKTHDLTLWTDQKQLNKNRYFKSYWLYGNRPQLDKIQNALIDLEFAQDGIYERRWFLIEEMEEAEEAKKNLVPTSSLSELLRFVPADTQLLRAYQSNDQNNISSDLFENLEKTIYYEKKLPTLPTLPTLGFMGDYYDPFNIDIDIDQDKYQDKYQDDTASDNSGNKDSSTLTLKSILSDANPIGVALLATPNYGSPRGDEESFVSFNRAMILECQKISALDKTKLEAAIFNGFQSRFLVKGAATIQPNLPLQWQSEQDGARSLKWGLFEEGCAYEIKGNYFIISNNQSYLSMILESFKSDKEPQSDLPDLQMNSNLSNPSIFSMFSMVRLQAGKETYNRLMSLLDGKQTASSDQNEADESDESNESDRPILFFSENLSSLLEAASHIDLVAKETADMGKVIFEIATYYYSD